MRGQNSKMNEQEAYRCLAIGILMQALLDYFEANSSKIIDGESNIAYYQIDASEWFANSEQFEIICEYLGIDPRKIRETIENVSEADRCKMKGNGKQEMLQILYEASQHTRREVCNTIAERGVLF